MDVSPLSERRTEFSVGTGQGVGIGVVNAANTLTLRQNRALNNLSNELWDSSGLSPGWRTTSNAFAWTGTAAAYSAVALYGATSLGLTELGSLQLGFNSSSASLLASQVAVEAYTLGATGSVTAYRTLSGREHMSATARLSRLLRSLRNPQVPGPGNVPAPQTTPGCPSKCPPPGTPRILPSTNLPQPAPVPANYVEEPIRNGIVHRLPGTTGNANTIRVMGPTQNYPNGHWVQYNAAGHAIDPATGQQTGSVSRALHRAMTHVPLPPPSSSE